MQVSGFHAVLARLRRAPESVRELYVDVSRNDPRMRELRRFAEGAGLRILAVDGARIDRMCPGRRHQGVVALVDRNLPAMSLEDLLAQSPSVESLLLLDGVTDPRNLGACLRAADGAGVSAVIAPKDHACLLNDVAIETSSGAAESVPYIMVTNLSRAIDQIQDSGFQVIGTADQSDPSLYDLDLSGPIAWVLGAEGKGLRRLTRERCDQLVSIPMCGAVESLNVSVAAGVVLYESLRQRRRSAAR